MAIDKGSNAATYRAAICELIRENNARRVVEVGVFKGLLSRLIVEEPIVQHLVIVDNWLPTYENFGVEHMDNVARSVLAWAETEPRVSVYRMDAVDASAWFGDGYFDLYQTDGDHSLEGCYADITAWWPKIRSGGISCGDNYTYPGVKGAVQKFFGTHVMERANGRVWWVRKP